MDMDQGPPPTVATDNNVGAQQQRQQVSQRRTFPYRLHEILAREDAQGALSWNVLGDAFYIHGQQALAEVLSRFRMSIELRTFQRQLNLYGFSGTRTDGISHPLFRRDTTEHLHLITRELGDEIRRSRRSRTRRNVSGGLQASARPQHADGTSLQAESSAPLAAEHPAQAESSAPLAEHPARPDEDMDEETMTLLHFLHCDLTKIAKSNRPLTPAEIAVYNRRWDSNCNSGGTA